MFLYQQFISRIVQRMWGGSLNGWWVMWKGWDSRFKIRDSRFKQIHW